MTLPQTTQPLMTPDSAWRQWRNTVNDRREHEHRATSDTSYAPGVQADADRATTAETQARATWLQTILEHFSRRHAEASELGKDVTTERGLKSLHVPCVDCLKTAGPKDRSHKIIHDDTKRYPTWASCGMTPVDPTTEPMPGW